MGRSERHLLNVRTECNVLSVICLAHDCSYPTRFRWVALQLDSLKLCRSQAKVRETLASLPKDLDETYDRILSKIRDDDYEYAYGSLQFLAFSARPMTVEEVAEVAAFNCRSERFDKLDNPLDVLEICSSLVTISNRTAGSTDQSKGESRERCEQ